MAEQSLSDRRPMHVATQGKAVRRIARRIGAHLLLIALSLLFALPFVWLVSTSLKPTEQLFRLPIEWIPRPFTWSNYPRALTYIPFFLYLRNTLYIALFNVVGTLISCSMVAYGFARIRWPGRNALFFVLIATLMIPYQVTLIPTFLIFRKSAGWVIQLRLPGRHSPAALFLSSCSGSSISPSARTVGGSEDRRCERVSDLPAHHSSAIEAGPGRRRPVYVQRQLERPAWTVDLPER
jgi:ABC-type glycerol-3-phosphate transport system permease component